MKSLPELYREVFKKYCKEFKDTVDPYNVVVCGMDHFQAYTYIDPDLMEKFYPKLALLRAAFDEAMDEEICEFESEWLESIK